MSVHRSLIHDTLEHKLLNFKRKEIPDTWAQKDAETRSRTRRQRPGEDSMAAYTDRAPSDRSDDEGMN